MKTILTIMLILATYITILSCSKESEPKIIEEELQVYFDSFVSEAAAYGIAIDLSDMDIGGYVENIETNGTIGQCISYSDGSNDVVVDARNWDNIDELEREYVVFHELGHCILERSHNNETNNNGICQSIMQSGENQCISRYNDENRSDLLEELFTNKD